MNNLPELSAVDTIEDDFPPPPTFVLKKNKNRQRRHRQKARKREETEQLREEVRRLNKAAEVANKIRKSLASRAEKEMTRPRGTPIWTWTLIFHIY